MLIASSAIPDPCALGVILKIVAAVPKLPLLVPVEVPAATTVSYTHLTLPTTPYV